MYTIPLFNCNAPGGKHYETLTVASFSKEVNPRLAKRPLKINGRLADLELTSVVKEATGVWGIILVEYFREREIKFIGLFGDKGHWVHLIHISRVIITYTLE